MLNRKYVAALPDGRNVHQNGTSEAGELFTFADLAVASNINLGGGNTQTFAGSFTKTTGAKGEAGTAHLAGSLLLSNNNFYRQFTDDPVATTAALALPQMRGSGLVPVRPCPRQSGVMNPHTEQLNVDRLFFGYQPGTQQNRYLFTSRRYTNRSLMNWTKKCSLSVVKFKQHSRGTFV
jgi:hypothetical protein